MNRTSKTRSASSGIPYLKPKLISWITSRSVGLVLAEVGEDPLAQLAQRQVRRVDDDVGLLADRVEDAPLLGDRAGDPALVGERMAMAGLREAPDQDLVARLEEDDLRPDPATLEGAAHRRQGQGRVAGAHVEDDRHPFEALAVLRDELGQVGQQLTGQVVDAGVAEVLEQLRRGRLAAADSPLRMTMCWSTRRRRTRAGLGCAGRARASRPGSRRSTAYGGHEVSLRRAGGPPRWDDQRPRQLGQDVHRDPEDGRADQVATGRDDRREAAIPRMIIRAVLGHPLRS